MANLKPTDKVIDLGSGEGRVVIAASKYCAKSVGVEINPFLYWISKIKTKGNSALLRKPARQLVKARAISAVRLNHVPSHHSRVWRAQGLGLLQRADTGRGTRSPGRAPGQAHRGQMRLLVPGIAVYNHIRARVELYLARRVAILLH